MEVNGLIAYLSLVYVCTCKHRIYAEIWLEHSYYRSIYLKSPRIYVRAWLVRNALILIGACLPVCLPACTSIAETMVALIVMQKRAAAALAI